MSLRDNDFLGDYPVCAVRPLIPNPGTISQSTFDDIDEQAAQLVGHDQRYQQLSPGRFHGRFTTAELGGDAWLFLEETNQSLAQHCHVPPAMVSFMFLLGPAHRVRLGRDDFGPEDLALFRGPAQFSVSCPADTIFCVVTLEDHRLARTLGVAEEQPTPGSYRLKSRHLRSTVAALRSLVATFLSMVAVNDDPVDDALAQLHLKEALLSTLALAVSTGARTEPNLTAPLYGQALALIDAHLSAISVTGLCTWLDVSRRTLEDIFRRQIGIGPARFIKARRLNEIRRQLQIDRDRPVADIAADWGLWHPSHFTQSYAEMFGELPSQGRQRTGAWIRHRVPDQTILEERPLIPDLTKRSSTLAALTNGLGIIPPWSS